MNRLIASIVGESTTTEKRFINIDDIYDAAESAGLLERIARGARDARNPIGWHLNKNKGRRFVDTQNRPFELGRRVFLHGCDYEVRFL